MKVAFWTAFGIYMRQFPPTHDPKTKWVNYHTGVKGIYFRLEAEPAMVRVSVTLEHSDPGIRALFYEQWEELRTFLDRASSQSWTWVPKASLQDGRAISRIYVEKGGVRVFERSNWPEIFEFMSRALVPLDRVWADCHEVFQDLAD
ncbi:MAG: hypothetical protein RLZZ165_2131 [Bacteroidota bacterium]